MSVKRSWVFPVAVVIALLAASQPGRTAAPIAGDSLCPQATPYVASYNEQTANDNTPVDDVLVTINKAISAYDYCAGTMGSNGSAEGRHYAQMRSAQFHVALGRLQRLLEKYDDARVQLNTAIALVKDTIDWRSSVRSAAATSFYREPAITIRDAAQAELDKLPKPAASPSPAPK